MGSGSSRSKVIDLQAQKPQSENKYATSAEGESDQQKQNGTDLNTPKSPLTNTTPKQDGKSPNPDNKSPNQDSKPPKQPPENGQSTDNDKTSKQVEWLLSREAVTDESRDNPSTAGQDVKGEEPAYVGKILRGDLSCECPSTAKFVRIFVSSTFTDTFHERNWLMEKVYPVLKEKCQLKGYDFQTVDMRWGIRDEAQDDHMTTDICLREIERCKKEATGPCFMSLMSHKYGYRDFPRRIESGEFAKLLSAVDDDDIRSLLNTWFKKDDNSVPAHYVLQSISSIVKDYLSDDKDASAAAKKEWYTAQATMYTALSTAAVETLPPERQQSYLQSVSHAEVVNALRDEDPERFLWFRRIIKDIDAVDVADEPRMLPKFRDTSGDFQKDKESRHLLETLEEDVLKKYVPEANQFEYRVSWQPGKGIDPGLNKGHEKYLRFLCKQAGTHLMAMLDTQLSSKQQAASGNPLFHEVLQHTLFLKQKCQMFHGRDGTMKKVKDYLTGDSEAPLVIHGESGCGKTSIMAVSAQMAADVFKNKDVVMVIRFLGTTPESSHIFSLLQSVITQLMPHGVQTQKDMEAMTMKELGLYLEQCLVEVGQRTQLVVFLDSLDQLSPSNNSRTMSWLPMRLPHNIKLVVSTLPEPVYGILPVLQNKLSNKPDNFLSVPTLDTSDISGILQKWLDGAKRKLTQFQKSLVLGSFDKCPLPLFLKLSFDEACRWSSYLPENQTTLQSTVRGAINTLFARMEKDHGKQLVSRALGYLTASQSGLSEAELEDILSCDDTVLSDVYRFWTPPVRRLPPLLLVRMKYDISQYVVTRAAEGKQVFYWYHRQFIEAARQRYMANTKIKQTLHSGLADFFAGTWAGKKEKPVPGTSVSACRHVASQPNQHQTSKLFNVRKLTNLPYHRREAGQFILLKSECLVNFDFIKSKVSACGLHAVLEDIEAVYGQDKAVDAVGEVLQVSQKALHADVDTLSSQFIERIQSSDLTSNPDLRRLLNSCSDNLHMTSSPPMMKAIGGQLTRTDLVKATELVADRQGKIAVAPTEDGTCVVYDVEKGKQIRELDIGVTLSPGTRLACQDSVIVGISEDSTHGSKLHAFDITTGLSRWCRDASTRENARVYFCVGGVNDSVVVLVETLPIEEIVVGEPQTYGTYTYINAGSGRNMEDPKPLPKPWIVVPGSAVGGEKYIVMSVYEKEGAEASKKIKMQVFISTRDIDHHLTKTLKDVDKNPKQIMTTANKEPEMEKMLAISADGTLLYRVEHRDAERDTISCYDTGRHLERQQVWKLKICERVARQSYMRVSPCGYYVAFCVSDKYMPNDRGSLAIYVINYGMVTFWLQTEKPTYFSDIVPSADCRKFITTFGPSHGVKAFDKYGRPPLARTNMGKLFRTTPRLDQLDSSSLRSTSRPTSRGWSPHIVSGTSW